MIDGPTPGQWADLRANRPVSEDQLSITPLTSCGKATVISIGVDEGGRLHLLIPVSSGPSPTIRIPDLNGLKVRHRRLATGQFLDLIANPSFEAVFTPFCREIAEAVLVKKREPWAATAVLIRAWQSAWKPARAGLEKTTQVGLFGELFVLRTLFIPCMGPAAVGHWAGPEAERHDFIVGNLHLEVKTTRKSRHEHEISRLDQLRVPPDRKLVVVSIQVEETIGGDETVATAVDSVLTLIRSDPAFADDFMTKLVTLGWTDDMRRSGELIRMSVRDAAVFEVDDTFPRIPDDFTPPTGVVSVRYTVDLANLPSLGLEEALMLVRSGAKTAA